MSIRIVSLLYPRLPCQVKGRTDTSKDKNIVRFLNVSVRTTKVIIFVETRAAFPQGVWAFSDSMCISWISICCITCSSQALQAYLLYWGSQQCSADTGMMGVFELLRVLGGEPGGLLRPRLEVQWHVEPNSILQWRQGTSRRPLLSPHCDPLTPQSPSSSAHFDMSWVSDISQPNQHFGLLFVGSGNWGTWAVYFNTESSDTARLRQ